MPQLKSIDIPQACHQSWQQMTPDDNGRHCQSCAKTVTDFTVMTNKEIIAHLSANTNVCGRFGRQQLGSINRQLLVENPPVNNKLKAWAMVMGLLSSVTFFNACAQVPTQIIVDTIVDIKRTVYTAPTLGKVLVLREVKGHVTDTQNQPIVRAAITTLSGTYKTVTDVKGDFALQVPYSVKEFKVGFIGYEHQIIAVDENENTIYKVKLNADILGEVVIVPVKQPFFKRMYYKCIKKPISKVF